jgi:putative addiction module component (TIGR02574 family)
MRSITIADLLHLSIPERLKLVEELWDSIAAEAADHPEVLAPSASEQREILRRSEAYRADPASAVPLEDVLKRIEREMP